MPPITDDDVDCPVCLMNEFPLELLGCGHVLCRLCLVKWTEATCPTCRADIHMDRVRFVRTLLSAAWPVAATARASRFEPRPPRDCRARIAFIVTRILLGFAVLWLLGAMLYTSVMMYAGDEFFTIQAEEMQLKTEYRTLACAPDAETATCTALREAWEYLGFKEMHVVADTILNQLYYIMYSRQYTV